MASRSKAKSYQARSISLPARSHPLTIEVEEHLYRLKQSAEAASTSTHNLAGLKDLQESLNDLLSSAATQKILARGRSQEECVNKVLEGSLRILDACCVSRDFLFRSKQYAQDLQSALRRRLLRRDGFENEIGLYMAARKQISKEIHKVLGDIRRTESKRVFSVILEKMDDDFVALLRTLTEVEAVSLCVLESILSFISGSSRTKSKSTGWCLVAKFISTKGCEGETFEISEMEKIDMRLTQLVCNKFSGDTAVRDAQEEFAALEWTINNLEASLESVYRSFMQTRVSLLNILSQ